MSGSRTCGSASEILGGDARPGDDALRGELVRRLELGLVARPGLDARGARRRSMLLAQPSRVAKRGSSSHSGCPSARANCCELVLADRLHDEVAVLRGSRRRCRACGACRARPSTRRTAACRRWRPSRRTSRRRRAGPSPVRSRWRSAACRPIAAKSDEPMSPSAPAGSRWAASRPAPVLVEAAHRLGDRRVGGPARRTATAAALPKPETET